MNRIPLEVNKKLKKLNDLVMYAFINNIRVSKIQNTVLYLKT